MKGLWLVVGMAFVIMLFSIFFTGVFTTEELEYYHIDDFYCYDLSSNIDSEMNLTKPDGSDIGVFENFTFELYDDSTVGRMMGFYDGINSARYITSENSTAFYSEDYFVDIYNDTAGVPNNTMRFDFYIYQPNVTYNELERGDGYSANDTAVTIRLLDGREFNMTVMTPDGTSIQVYFGDLMFKSDNMYNISTYRYYLDDYDLFVDFELIHYADSTFFYSYRFGSATFDTPMIETYDTELIRTVVLIPVLVFFGVVIIMIVKGGRVTKSRRRKK